MATLTINQVPILYRPKVLPVKSFSLSNSCSKAFFPKCSKPLSVSSRSCFPYCSMQQLVQPPPALDITDLKVTIDKTAILTPLEETPRRTMFLSNIDQRLNFKCCTLQFFAKNPDFPFEQVVAKLEMAYKKLLIQYDFLAGRLKWNIEEHRLEIDCNSAGAGFVVASSELRLDELGDLVEPKLGYQQLAARKWKSLRPEDQPLIVFQLTSLKCGGFVLGFTINHIALDGIGSKTFGLNLASMVTNDTLVLPPCNNRALLAARTPLQVDFPHPELISLESLQGQKTNPIPLMATFQKLDCKVFNLSAKHVNNLKELDSNAPNSNSFSLVAAHIWRCVALARNSENDPDKISTILYAINIRPIVRPRLPASYSGNGILNAYSTTTCRELKEGPISHIAEIVSGAATRMTDEYIRSTIDWAESHKVFPNGDLILTSWLRHGLNDIEYPWGKAKWSCPVVPTCGNNAIILLPDIKRSTTEGMNVMVSLPRKEMEKFQDLFHKLKW